MIASRSLIALAALVASACAPALSNFQPAHVPKKGHVQLEAGVDLPIPTGHIRRIIDAAETLESVAENRALTDSERNSILEAAINLAANAPVPVPHAGVAWAPFESWELGLRMAAGGYRLGVRHQFLEQQRSGVDLSAGLAVSRATYEPPVSSVLGTIEIEDFVRWTVEVPLAVGKHGDWYRWWAGPRVFYTSFSQAITLNLPNVPAELASVSGNGFYFGAQGGAVFGYRWLFFGPELTLAQLSADAEFKVLGETIAIDLDTFVVYPGIAVMGEF